MKILLLYPEYNYLVVLRLTQEEINLINDVDVDTYSAVDTILAKRNIPFNEFSPVYAIDESDSGFQVFEDNGEHPIYTIK